MKVLPRSVRTQVTASVALIVLVVVALTGLAIALRIDDRDRADVDHQLIARADRVRSDADKLLSGGPGTAGGSPDEYGELLAGSQSLVRLLSGDAVVAERGGLPAGDIPPPAGYGLSTLVIGGQSWRSLVQPLDAVGGDRLQLLQDLEQVKRRLDANQQLAAVAGAVASVIAALGTWLVTGLVLQPLQRLRTGAMGIRPGDLAQRLPRVSRPREVADLSATLNGMLERLQVSMLSTRRFTADAGHELRTPLTSLGMDLETLRRNPELSAEQREQALAAMTVQHQRVVALLDGLQALARGDAGALPARVGVELVDLVAEAVEHARHRHPDVSYNLGGGMELVLVQGWRDGLRIAVDNLLDNAALHGRPGGAVQVCLVGDGGNARVTVGDDGPGIPADQRELMKQRFARGAGPRSGGSGLGLALVEQQAVLHGGALHLDDSPGGGLRATLLLPMEPAADLQTADR
jgi:two-component system sensor histidine kinase PrrB